MKSDVEQLTKTKISEILENISLSFEKALEGFEFTLD